MHGDTCSFCSLFISFFPPLVFFLSPPTNLYASHAFTLHFPCWLWVSPLWRTLPVSSECANIACLYPLGGIMAAITHWCSTKSDISLSLCWQTAYTSHCSVALSFCFLHVLPFVYLNLSLHLSVSFCHLSLYLQVSLLFYFHPPVQAGIVQGKGHHPWRMLLQK